MTIWVTVRIAATLEDARRADEANPGLYDEIIALARAHGLVSHRRVYREGEIMDIDEWESEEARAAFRAEAQPLIDRMRAARGSAPSTAETWLPYPHTE
jgi:hypothetical protein